MKGGFPAAGPAPRLEHGSTDGGQLVASSDDKEYRRNARNMAFVLAAITLVIFASIFIPPIINPVHEQFSPEASANSPYGFSLNLSINASHVVSGGHITFTVWINNSSRQVNNVTAQDNWPVTNLGALSCAADLPMRVGVMKGYYTEDNLSVGQVLPLSFLQPPCPVGPGFASTPYFLLQPLGSEALVQSTQGIERVNISATASSNRYIDGGATTTFAGVFTAVAADEWGDSVTTHFVAGPP
jgi:hypothetical protein